MALSAGTVILSMKTLLISAGTVSLLMAMRSVLPLLLFDFRMIWGVFMAWLRPPYLYFVINGIILAIVFASRFQHERLEKQLSGQLQPLITVRTPPPAELVAFAQPEYKSVVEESFRAAFGDEPPEELDLKPVVVNGSMVDLNEEKLAEDDAIAEEVKEVLNPALDPPPEPETELLPSLAAEKPLVSTRFAHRKPSVRASPEGSRGLRVSRPKKQETLETTWRMITEGRHVPLTRHLRKSDALENQSRHITAADGVVNPTHQPPRNGESPKAAPTHSSRSAWIMRKEPSLSQDELNRRVEAFIKKFNEEMRIQRQQSLQQYMEMINRGAN
ncbi:uncharacterized protein LOC116028518 isoform X3 [Ipomoea triloba]|uniref:uncharacterized protein LOC116028518 isoform X1 n=1 Tax=Ipomoea triloba TaxID=35885 RepID=UPI00125D1EDC|nr:uncharacterized protein LOC116028518 isoform X1 [Ipomoea triloba]XP_031126109.1 uncharacterized protein LOC116028518 isoform X2 [Ipomoea triloba]XP_031126110.1 uncharacterized protein LOC116028518 isoform X3 [Ipomoea triloba]